MYALVTLAATLVVVTISGLIIAVAPRLEPRDVRRAAYGDPDHTGRATGRPSRLDDRDRAAAGSTP